MRKAVAKTFAALLAAAAAAVVALDASEVLPASPTVLVAAISVSTALAALATIAAAWAEWRGRRLGEQRDLAEVQLAATGWAVVDQVAGLDFRDLGLAVYRVERVWWWPFRQRLRRLHRVRSARRPVTSGITWRPGKGVIGACVTRGQVVAVDLTQMYADLGPVDEADWALVPDDVRLGLSYAEYLDVKDKYAVVVSCPVIDDSGARTRVLGCVALDGPNGRFADFSSDEVLGLLSSAAQGLLRVV